MEILRTQYKNQRAISIESIIWLDVDMMYGVKSGQTDPLFFIESDPLLFGGY
jgi:hypothetical protein